MNLDLFQEIMRDDYGQKMTMYDNSRVFTPEKIAKQMVDMLPDQVWDPKTKFLDPCCKTGVFLIEIYNKLDEALQKLPEYSDKSKRHNHILNNQIFGIALDDESLIYSRRNVAGDIFYENIQYLPQFMRYVKDKDYTNIKKLLKQEEVFKMDKFDVVIGNPPYQENNGGGNGSGGRQIYNLFMTSGIEFADYLCMIVKNNWMQSEALEKDKDKLIDFGIVKIINYPKIGDIFDNVSVSVNIVLCHKGYTGDTSLIEIVDNNVIAECKRNLHGDGVIVFSKNGNSIVEKVRSATKNSMQKYVVGRMPFGINTNGRLGQTGNSPYLLDSDDKSNEYSIGVLYLDGTYKYFRYAKRQDITKGTNMIDKYKLICGKLLHKNSSVITNIGILKPENVCQAQYSVLYYSEDLIKVNNACKYIKTIFVRYLTSIKVDNTSLANSSRFSLVPLQDFTSDSDIDWSKSVDEIDKQLYKKYNLTQEEIDYIEKTIKPMK